MASHNRRRVERINAKIPIAQVLHDLGYAVRADGGNREQQFPCDLHGDGVDIKPSARVYPASNSWYCFMEDKTRDAIETVRAKKGLGFMEAIAYLEKTYGLEPLPWEEGEHEHLPTASEEIWKSMDQTKTFEDDRKRVQRLLEGATEDRTVPMEDVLTFWEAFDRLVYLVTEKKIPEKTGRAALMVIKARFEETRRKKANHV